jgi:hypothetical protein
VTGQSEELLTLLNDTEAHDSLDDEKLCQLTFFGIAVYGISNDQTMIGPLMSLYRVFNGKIDAKEKLELYRAIQDKLLEWEISVNALLPFILEECNFTLASAAALDYAICRPLNDNDPMKGFGLVTLYVTNAIRYYLCQSLISLMRKQPNYLLDNFPGDFHSTFKDVP